MSQPSIINKSSKSKLKTLIKHLNLSKSRIFKILLKLSKNDHHKIYLNRYNLSSKVYYWLNHLLGLLILACFCS